MKNKKEDTGFSTLLESVARDAGVKPEDIVKLAGQVAFQESKNSPTATQVLKGEKTDTPTLGAGRGLYQFESASRKGSSSQEQAVKNLKRYYTAKGMETPQWLNKIDPANFNPADLSPDQQTMLFLGMNQRFGNKQNEVLGNNFSKIKEKDFSPVEWWAKYHKKANVKEAEKQRMRSEQNLAGEVVPYGELAGLVDPFGDTTKEEDLFA